MKRMISTLLALALLLACVPGISVHASAKESLTSIELPVDADLATNDELFAAYAESVLYGIDYTPFGIAAGQRLTGDEKVLYEALVPVIKDIAAGKRSSTVIGIGQELFAGYPVDVPATFTGGVPTQESMRRVLRALLTDMPYEMYWFDKTTGWRYLYNTDTPLKYIQFSFPVAVNYAGSGEYTVNTVKTGAAAAAASNARSIVNSLASKSDYEKLAGYKDAICNLVSYDEAAADTGIFAQNNDPWQLIHVFDGNSSTNVVCEGYSKAFMYLCDLTVFDSDVTCITVTGDAGGGHMWNIVTLGGKNYMVDVTNSDTGTIGSAGGLFLAGSLGTPSSGYRFLGYLYTYDATTLGLWGSGSDSILTLAAEDYDPDTILNPDHVEIITLSDDISFTISGQTVTVRNDIPCRAGYTDKATKKHIAITAVENNDGSYSFTAPEGVTEVLLVIACEVNGDKRVTASDIATLNAHIRGKKLLTDEAMFAVDINGDGLLNENDITNLTKVLLGKATLDW